MTYDRLSASNAAVLFVDHQTGLANGVQTQSPPDFINNVKALRHHRADLQAPVDHNDQRS